MILFALNSAWYFWSVIVFVVYCIRCNSLSPAVLKEAFAYAAVAGGIFWVLSVLSQWWELYAVWLFVGIALSFFVRASSEGIVPWGKTVQNQLRHLLGDIETKIVEGLCGLFSNFWGSSSSNSSTRDGPLPTPQKSAPSVKKPKALSKSKKTPPKKKTGTDPRGQKS